MLKIDTIKNNERMSTQDLLLKIEDAVNFGETDFEISASGQHDIGGPLWHPEGKILKFHVTNAGQRVGSMALPNTEIIVEGSTSVGLMPAELLQLKATQVILPDIVQAEEKFISAVAQEPGQVHL